MQSRPDPAPVELAVNEQQTGGKAMTVTDQLPNGTALPAGTANPAEPPRRRPSPYPRPATDGNSPPSSGESGQAPDASSEPHAEPEVSSLQSEPVTVREWLRGWLVALRGYWIPPAVLTEPPATVAELAAYAWRGGWTASETGPARRLGIWWHRLVSLPATTVCRYVEWVLQRPGRAVPVFVLWKLLINTGPGPWAADHLIRPVLGLLAWVLL